MKILFTGGGTGGHFYPIIAVAQAINRIADDEKLVNVRLYFMSDAPYDKRVLFETGIEFRKVEAGKVRTYRSILNFFDLFKTGFGVLRAIAKMFLLYPDVVYAKGGYASFPALIAAKFFRIPVVLNPSDTIPGRVEQWAGKFAERIGIAFPEAARYFPKEKTALVGIPERKELATPSKTGAFEYLKLDKNVPTLLIIGGSSGAMIINDSILDILPRLLEKFQVIHQTGIKNFKEVTGRANVVLRDSAFKERYRPFDFLNASALRMAAGVACAAVSRAGGAAIFDLALWKLPAILIPISESRDDHQRTNAFSYAHAGAATVIEEKNLTPHVLFSEIERLMENAAEREKMASAAVAFARPDAADRIARELIAIALQHEG